MKLSAAAIAAATRGVVLRDAPAGPVLTDTRSLLPGAWFLALMGERFDGHAFLSKAQVTGAAGCIISKPTPADWTGGVVRVADTVAALQDLGRYARRQLTTPVIGLTGSSGKTTTRALISLALSPLGSVHQTEGNLNNHLGVPISLLATPEDSAATVIEMGTSSPGEIAVLAGIATPDVRLIVNVGPAHLAELGGLDGVAQEKGALFATARPGDILCVNLDDERVRGLRRPTGTRAVTWGKHPDADVRLVSAVVAPDVLATRARFEVDGRSLDVVLPAPGEHLAHNAAAALAVARALDVPLESAAAALVGYEPVGMRLRIEPLPCGALAFNDAYNANPASTAASLRTLAALPGRRVAVLGDMLELGEDEATWHERVAALAGELGLELVVLVGPRMSLAKDACRGAGDVWAAVDGLDLTARLSSWLSEGDRILFKGSRGARVERLLQALREGNTADSGGMA